LNFSGTTSVTVGAFEVGEGRLGHMVKPLRGEIEAELAGKTYKLRIGIGELEEIESDTGIGILSVLSALGSDAKVSHLTAILASAIKIGPASAGKVRAREIIEEAGLGPSIIACAQILTAVLTDTKAGNAAAVAAE